MDLDPLARAWGAIAPAAGLDAALPLVRLKDRGAGAARRLLGRIDGPGGPMALRVTPGMEPERWREALRGQREMHEALAGCALDRAPRVIGWHEGERAILAQWVPGRSLIEEMTAAPGHAGLAKALCSAARWAGALHAAMREPAAPLAASNPVAWVARLRAKAVSLRASMVRRSDRPSTTSQPPAKRPSRRSLPSTVRRSRRA